MSYTGAGKNFMDVVAWTGTSAVQSIGGLSFSPDLVWIKRRDGSTYALMFDTFEGPLQYLNTANTTGSTNLNNSLLSFDDDGFTVGSNQYVNQLGI